MARRPKVLVVGGGPAGLSAGVHLLEEAGGALEVELVSMGHHLGGKASSWRDADGYSVDHGFHAVFGFYEQLRALARRAGVDLERALVSSGGVSHYYDERAGAVHTFEASRNGLATLLRLGELPGLSASERRQLGEAAVRIARTLGRLRNRETLDDVCFKAFLLQHGAPASFLRHPGYRQAQELAFNHPHELSTYIALKGMELFGHCYADARFFYIAGGVTELFWNPIADYFQRLGGGLRLRQKLIGLERRGGRLVAARFGVPDTSTHHQEGRTPWPNEVPVAEGEPFVDPCDALVCTLPAACLCELEPGGPLWEDPFFAKVKNLSSVSTINLQLWTREPLGSKLRGTLSGLPLPLSYLVDYKPLVPELARDGRYGAALQWVGIEAGYEAVPDEDLIRQARADLARVPGYEGSDRHEVVHAAFHRNRANHRRYLLTEPGTLRFRPTVRTPIARLYLAGDWVRNEVEIPCMEAAIRCGRDAARAVLEDL